MNTLQLTLQSLFLRQARDVLSRLKIEELVLGKVPDLRHWVLVTFNAVRYDLRTHYTAGQLDYWKSKPRRKSLSRQPMVLDAVDGAAMAFCQETLDTATGNLKTVLRNLRKILKQGIEQGQDAAAVISLEVTRCFADPVRAKRIAVTETHRARCLGYLGAATEAGDREKRWKTSANSCAACKKLDRKTVEISLPFVILPGGGPYATVLTPPLHPNCQCTIETL